MFDPYCYTSYSFNSYCKLLYHVLEIFSVLWFLLDLKHSYNTAKYIYHIIRSFFVCFIGECTLLNVDRLIVCTLQSIEYNICASVLNKYVESMEQ